MTDIEHRKHRDDDVHCGCFTATSIARCVTDVKNEIIIEGKSFEQQFPLDQGLKKFEDRERAAVFKEFTFDDDFISDVSDAPGN